MSMVHNGRAVRIGATLLALVFAGMTTAGGSCSTTAASAPAVVTPAVNYVKADGIDQFLGTWKGTWRRLEGGQGGGAKVSIRPGASTFANADFHLDNGVGFPLAPDYRDGELLVDNGEAMQMRLRLTGPNSMHIEYERFGNKGEYYLTRDLTIQTSG